MLEIKNIGKEMKNAFDRFISRLYMAKARILSFRYLKRNIQNWKAKKKILKARPEHQRTIGQL